MTAGSADTRSHAKEQAEQIVEDFDEYITPVYNKQMLITAIAAALEEEHGRGYVEATNDSERRFGDYEKKHYALQPHALRVVEAAQAWKKADKTFPNVRAVAEHNLLEALAILARADRMRAGREKKEK